MDAGYASALFGLAGALIGSLANVITTWATHNSQHRHKHEGANYARKQKLFSDFISEASRLYVDALSHQKDDAKDLVGLYALVAKMRLIAPGPTVTAAEDAMKGIVEAYLEPNRTLREMRALAQEVSSIFFSDLGRNAICTSRSKTRLFADGCPRRLTSEASSFQQGGPRSRSLRFVRSTFAQLPEDEQDEAIDSLVEVIFAEGLTEEQVERLQVIVDDSPEVCGQHGPN